MRRGAQAIVGALLVLAILALSLSQVHAADRAKVIGTIEAGFGRIVITFADRFELPKYKVRSDSGILALTFDGPVSFALPDVAATMPSYISVARLDPDGHGLRLGLRGAFTVSTLEAGEQLFIDLLPASWKGLPPALPPETVAALADRAREAEKLAEQRRVAEEAARTKPVVDMRVGRSPTFTRFQFNWSVKTAGKFALEGTVATLTFEWPVPIDVSTLRASLPAQVAAIVNGVTPEGSTVALTVAEGVTPRFYQNSPTEFVIDIDTGVPQPDVDLAALPAGMPPAKPAEQAPETKPGGVTASFPPHPEGKVATYVNSIGETARLVFPFSQQTPAAAFQRGDTLWLLFDTEGTIERPVANPQFDRAVRGLSVQSTGDTQVVRLDLAPDRLASLGTDGAAWILSLGDILLAPTDPLTLSRRNDGKDLIEAAANLGRPSRVHEFRDPVVGDVLQVVTAFAPARGIVRDLSFVDFDALGSIQGLVVRPQDDYLQVAVAGAEAVISAADGLRMSPIASARLGTDPGRKVRTGFIDMDELYEPDLIRFGARQMTMTSAAANAPETQRDRSRLDLAQFLLANDFGNEAIGVLDLLQTEQTVADLKPAVSMARAVADTLAFRPDDALTRFNAPELTEQVDVALWRTIVRVQLQDYAGAKADALTAENVISSYPDWVQNRFLLSAIRAACETGDAAMATRFAGLVALDTLTLEQNSELKLLTGWTREMIGDTDAALAFYGEVVNDDFRPERAEAVLRTLQLMDQQGTIDLDKATSTLAAETLLWRGNALEAQMQSLLASFYFRNHDYREGFETARQTVQFYPDSPAMDALANQAQGEFEHLFLDGAADALSPVEALGVYYDFRTLTPPGARGDQMIRNLARRLVKVDLLSQAIDLLKYQVDSRLSGIGKAQVATELALIQLANHQPEAAMHALQDSYMADLPPTLERQRRVLQARALIDSGRDELALDMLSKLDGRDAEILRIDAHWQAKRYDQASSMIEALYAPEATSGSLAQPTRMNVIKAAVGFVLANDRIGLSRLRAKFSAAMANSAEWSTFDFVTGTTPPSGEAFTQVAKAVAGLDTLNAFLGSYRELYAGGDGLVPAYASAN